MSFYRDVIGLPLLHLAVSGVDDFGCAIFGLPGASATFELVPASDHVPIDQHEQLVLYLHGKPARDAVARRITEAGHEPVDQYQYWELNGAITFLDPDGRELVLAPWVFGQEPPPMLGMTRPRPDPLPTTSLRAVLPIGQMYAAPIPARPAEAGRTGPTWGLVPTPAPLVPHEIWTVTTRLPEQTAVAVVAPAARKVPGMS